MNDTSTRKTSRELDVFRGFIEASGLPANPETISHPLEPEPDILCCLAGSEQYFELSEVFWEPSEQPGHTLARGLDKSTRAARLVAQGQTAASAGSFQYPPLASFTQSLERKLRKSYYLRNDRRCSLLLYYDRQTPVEPYDLLFGLTDALSQLLIGCVFDVVWLYHHAFPGSCSVNVGGSAFAALSTGASVPLSSWSTAESTRAVVGRLEPKQGCLTMSFDARYGITFYQVLRSLSGRRQTPASVDLRTG
jgi:hypothetical protein